MATKLTPTDDVYMLHLAVIGNELCIPMVVYVGMYLPTGSSGSADDTMTAQGPGEYPQEMNRSL